MKFELNPNLYNHLAVPFLKIPISVFFLVLYIAELVSIPYIFDFLYSTVSLYAIIR